MTPPHAYLVHTALFAWDRAVREWRAAGEPDPDVVQQDRFRGLGNYRFARYLDAASRSCAALHRACPGLRYAAPPDCTTLPDSFDRL